MHTGRFMDRIPDAVQLLRIEDAVIEPKEDLRIAQCRRERFEPQKRRRQGSMDTRGTVMKRRAPHAMVDPDRRGDIAAYNRRAAS
jgi:hypothetical protein